MTIVHIALVPILLGYAAASTVQATPIALSFHVTGFQPGAPTDPVAGLIIYDAISATSNINSLIAIDLTIAGHAYTLGEVGFAQIGVFQQVGGVLTGVDTVAGGTTDFLLQWVTVSAAPAFFVYSIPPISSEVFQGMTFTRAGGDCTLDVTRLS